MTTTPPPRRAHRGILITALVLQCLVLTATFLAGLGWGGWSYLFANLLAAVGVAILGVIGSRGFGSWILLVPLATAVVAVGLYQLDAAITGAAACTDAEERLADAVPPPPGINLEVRGSAEGCYDTAEITTMTSEEVHAHYRRALLDGGWRLRDVGRAASPAQGMTATRQGHTMIVEISTGTITDESGSSDLVMLWVSITGS